MKAKELSLGDKVYLNYGGIQEVAIVTGLFECGDIQVLGQSAYVDEAQADIKPIPLTPEIMKANGFKEVYKSTFQTIYILQLPMGGDFLEYVFLACSDNCFKIFLYGVEREKTYINNVHQLQQALRLCGLNDLADNFKV